MHSIIMVDDEPAILNGLRKAISWAEYGFETVAQAADGAQALALMEERRFDIMISDIRMPHMSGLELLKKVRTTYPWISCVILTAYSEFDYVLEALRLGVDNFLLKPINPQELTSTIQCILERFDKPRSQGSNTSESFNQNVLYRWMSGDFTDEELDKRARLANINLFSRHYSIVSIRQVNGEPIPQGTASSVRKILLDSFDCYEFEADNGGVDFIIGGHLISSQGLWELLGYPQKKYQGCRMVIGAPVAGSKKLSLCFWGIQDILIYLNLFDTDVPILAEYAQARLKEAARPTLNRELQAIFHEENPRNVTAMVQKYVETGKEEPDSNSGGRFMKIIVFLNYLFNELFKRHMPKGDFEKFKRQAVEAFSINDSESKLAEKLTAVILETQRLVLNEFENASPIIRRVIAHLKNNLTETVSIKRIAQQFSVNPSYLGYLFKEETGLFFSDFLNRLRITEAEALLLHTDYTMNDIAQMTGYSNTTYFNRIFKKIHLISPAKYRALNREG